jgi:hypothetical protein
MTFLVATVSFLQVKRVNRQPFDRLSREPAVATDSNYGGRRPTHHSLALVQSIETHNRPWKKLPVKCLADLSCGTFSVPYEALRQDIRSIENNNNNKDIFYSSSSSTNNNAISKFPSQNVQQRRCKCFLPLDGFDSFEHSTKCHIYGGPWMLYCQQLLHASTHEYGPPCSASVIIDVVVFLVEF